MAAEGEIEGFPYPRDLLRRFSGEEAAAEASPEFAGEVELSLGLSLGGGGGGGEKGLARSSSISKFPPADRGLETQWLARAHSLPAESEEEWRRRKEMQSLKRMEAKRKRSEKRARERKAEPEEEALVGPTAKPKEEAAAAAVCDKAKGVADVGSAGAGACPWCGPGKPASQGSIGSQGSSSSGVSDFEGKTLHGLETTGLKEVRSSSMLEHAASNAPTPSPILKKHLSPPKGEDEPPKRRKISTAGSNGAAEMERSMMDEMPYVSTRGDGPNGRRIEGFLYRYRKGEEVRIMCVCHGSFLTPAEFVKHAGGGDVDHPLRHIVVNLNPFAML